MTDLFAGPPIRFAVVGLGLMGQRHCQVLQRVPQAELVAVCDQDPDKASRVSVENGVDALSNYPELLDRDDIDAIVICLPSGLHADYGMLAAKAGKHVVVEKPIDSRTEPAKQLAECCDRAQVKCITINQNRYSAGLASLKLAVSRGLMGNPSLARATVKWFRHDEYYTESSWRGKKLGEYGGVLINQAVHSIDTLQWLFGRPDQVTGFINNSRPDVLEMEDNAVAILRWNSGLLASLEASTSSAPGFDELYEVHSATASMIVEKGRVVYWYHKDGISLPEVALEELPAGLDGKLSMFYRQYLEVVNCILDMPHDLSSASESITVVETIERIYQSFAGS